MRSRTLFGPFGTELIKSHPKTTADSADRLAQIIHLPEIWMSIQRIAASYLQHGATVACTPTYGARWFLNPEAFSLDLQGVDDDGANSYHAALSLAWEAVTQALQQTSTRGDVWRLLNFGSVYDAFLLDPATKTPLVTPSTTVSREFHSLQLAAAERFSPDGVLFEAINSVDEAVGIALAAQRHQYATIISLLVDSKGHLPSGESFADVVRAVNGAVTQHVFLGLNCCPTSGIDVALRRAESQIESFGGVNSQCVIVYPNASTCSPEELNGSQNGIIGVEQPQETALYLQRLAARYNIRIIGGCCGFAPSDIGHIHRLSL